MKAQTFWVLPPLALEAENSKTWIKQVKLLIPPHASHASHAAYACALSRTLEQTCEAAALLRSLFSSSVEAAPVTAGGSFADRTLQRAWPR
jgi:hypothetical protein